MPDHLTGNTHKKRKKKEKKNSHVSKEKAKEILRDGSIRGKKLTKKQRGFFGARAGGATKSRVKRIFS